MSNLTERNKSLAFLILIGGKSARFGSDKGIFEFMGKPLISYQLEILTKFNRDIFLVSHSKEQAQSYIDKIDIKQIMAIIIDEKNIVAEKELHSPMIGLYSGFKELSEIGYEKAFALSCDMPLITQEVVNLLINKSKGYDCCIPRWNNGFLEPLFAIYPTKKAYVRTKLNLENRIYKLVRVLDKNWNINYISVENEIQNFDEKLTTFINVNGPIDIEKLVKLKN